MTIPAIIFFVSMTAALWTVAAWACEQEQSK